MANVTIDEKLPLKVQAASGVHVVPLRGAIELACSLEINASHGLSKLTVCGIIEDCGNKLL